MDTARMHMLRREAAAAARRAEKLGRTARGRSQNNYAESLAAARNAAEALEAALLEAVEEDAR